MNSQLAGIVILLSLGTSVAPGLYADGGRTRLFDPSPCPEGLPLDIRVDCGFLVVPEKRGDDDDDDDAGAIVRHRDSTPQAASYGFFRFDRGRIVA
jgi:hypothetical protein